MKYSSANKTLVFSSDDEVIEFHDQLTDIMRAVMSGVGGNEINETEAFDFTKRFFDRYAILTELLSQLRAYIPRNVGVS